MVVSTCLQAWRAVWGDVVPTLCGVLAVPGGCAACSCAWGSAVSASPFLLVSALLGGACSMASPLACRHGCSGVVVDLEVLPYCVGVGCSGVEGFVPQGAGSGCGSAFLCQVVRGCVALQVAWWPALVGQLVNFRGRRGCPAARGPGQKGGKGGVRGLRATRVPAPG